MPPRARLVRRAPLIERIQAYLNPFDFLLWLAEELNSNDWEDFQKQWAYPAGLVLNFVFIVARANSTSSPQGASDVFSDAYDSNSSGWLSWLALFAVYLLGSMSFLNAFYTFWRKRHYRLFEANIDTTPNTPSALRVRVDSSPFAFSPFKMLQNTLLSSAESRAHPDPTRDVWELHVWDPTPLCVRIFCLFSPGHVLLYCLSLPLNALDPRPSVTVATTLFLAFLLSAQLLLLQGSFSQQARDTALINKEVQNEYNTKFVQPMIFHPVRDAGTQMATLNAPSATHEVLVSTPKTYVNRGFNPRPNPNYAKHYDVDNYSSPQAIQHRIAGTPTLHSPRGSSPADYSSPIKQGASSTSQVSAPSSAVRGEGHLGVYSHAQSPLKKSVAIQGTPQQQRYHVAFSSSNRSSQQGIPQKRAITPGRGGTSGTPGLQNRVSHLRGEDNRRDSSNF